MGSSRLKRDAYHVYDAQYYNTDTGYYSPVERQDFSDQLITFGGQLTDFGGQVSNIGGQVNNFGSGIGSQLEDLARQQGDLLSPFLQNSQAFVPVVFGSVLVISTLAIAVQNFFYPRYRIPEEPASCPPGWLQFEQKCFRQMVTKLNFDDAQANCIKNGATLATVRSIYEQEFLINMDFNKMTWLGGTDKAQQQTFRWVTGEDGPTGFFTNFKTPKTPTHLVGQDCIQMDGDGFWNDVVCTKKLLSFCQKPAFVGANTCGRSCPLGWTMEGCKCFQVVQTTAIQDDAETNCVKKGGHLASVTSLEIERRLFCLEPTSDFWIGLNDLATEGTYVWPNGDAYGTYTNWLTNPHVSSASLQYVKAKGGSGQWENVVGTLNLKYACEIELDQRVTKIVPSCATGWIQEGNMCYAIKPDPKTWVDAKTVCIAEGGNLATVTNKALDTKLKAEATKQISPANDFWIGLNDIGIATQGTYQWANGDTWLATDTNPFWNTGQPNHVVGQDCVKIKKSGTGWDDVACTKPFPYACQRPL